MDTIDTVLVPTDGSDHAIRAAEHGSALASAFDADLHVVNVIDLRLEGGPFNAGGLREEVIERLREDGRRWIDRTEAVLDAPDEATTAVLEGVPVEEIVQYSDDHDVDLISMGTQGRTGLDRYVAGSVAEGVVRRARVPVLTVRANDWGTGAGAYEDIVVPTDGSKYAERAIEPALEIAKRFDAHVHAVHVVDVRNATARGEYGTPAGLLDALRSQGESAVETVATRASDLGLPATTSVAEGIPPVDILEYAEEADADMIAMGTAGRTGLTRFLLGSTTERIIRHAEIPVLAVNARDE